MRAATLRVTRRMGIEKPSKQPESNDRAHLIPLAALERTRADVEQITDGLNKLIDPGIREGVAVLRALNLVTTQSCEGHLDRGSPSPYIDIEAQGQPAYHFQGEQEEQEALAREHDILPEEIRAWPHEEDRAVRAERAHGEWEKWRAHPSREQTSEYRTWEAADRAVHTAMGKLIGEFYAARPKPPQGYVLLEHDRLRTSSDLYDKFFAAALAHDGTGLSPQDRERLRDELPAAQAEMSAFIEFLKSKFIESAARASS